MKGDAGAPEGCRQRPAWMVGHPVSDASGTMWWRSLALGARTPWYRMRLRRGGGTRAASFSINSNGDRTRKDVPSDRAYRCFNATANCSANSTSSSRR